MATTAKLDMNVDYSSTYFENLDVNKDGVITLDEADVNNDGQFDLNDIPDESLVKNFQECSKLLDSQDGLSYQEFLTAVSGGKDGQAYFNNLDLNKDGILDQNEIDKTRMNFKDSDNDGLITKKEALAQATEEYKNYLAQYDANKNGFLEQSEISPHLERPVVDYNNDGKITEKEFLKSMKELFAALDTDKSKSLTATEIDGSKVKATDFNSDGKIEWEDFAKTNLNEKIKATEEEITQLQKQIKKGKKKLKKAKKKKSKMGMGQIISAVIGVILAPFTMGGSLVAMGVGLANSAAGIYMGVQKGKAAKGIKGLKKQIKKSKKLKRKKSAYLDLMTKQSNVETLDNKRYQVVEQTDGTYQVKINNKNSFVIQNIADLENKKKLTPEVKNLLQQMIERLQNR